MRVQRRPPAAGRRRGRAYLPAAAGIPYRDGRQVRFAAVGGAGRRASGRGRPLRAGRVLRRRRARDGQASGGAASAAGSDHPGRAASDRRAARHDGRSLRDGDRGAGGARGGRADDHAEERRLDGHGTSGSGPGSGAVRTAGDAGVPAAWAGSAGHVLRPHRAVVEDARAAGSTSASPRRAATRRC